jgi:hypothetical protein
MAQSYRSAAADPSGALEEGWGDLIFYKQVAPPEL